MFPLMNILQVSASYKPAYTYGGPIVSVAALGEQLCAAGHRVTVLTTTANGSEELPEAVTPPEQLNGVTVFYCRRITGDPTHFSPSLLRRLWQMAPGYDVVHIHSWWNTVAVLSCLVALLRGKPVVLSPRGMLSEYSFTNRSSFGKRAIHALLGQFLLRRCRLHGTSAAECERLKAFSGSHPPVLIPNLLHFPEEIPDQAGVRESDTLRLLFFSRIEQKKGLPVLFQALQSVNIPWVLHIAGTGPADYLVELKELAQSLGIAPQLVWVGMIGPEEKFACLQSHDLLVLPSHNENFANVVIESLAVGTPVLVSRAVGLSRYVEDADLGWVSEADAGSIAAVIVQAAHDTKKRIRIRATAPTQVRTDFNEAELLRRYQQLYQQLRDGEL